MKPGELNVRVTIPAKVVKELKEVPWKEIAPGIRERKLKKGDLTLEHTELFCMDCGGVWPGMFIVHDELWEMWVGGRGTICIDCFGTRMGRRVTIDDLKPVLGNEIALYLADRPVQKRVKKG